MKKEIETFKKALKYLEKGYGKKMCKENYYDCVACQANWVMGWLRSHIDLLKEEAK